MEAEGGKERQRNGRRQSSFLALFFFVSPQRLNKKKPAVAPDDEFESFRCSRRHGPGERADQRFDFERDRDRVLYSWEFRRLAGVTQVVHAAEGHVFHNRLTHSLKVAQIGRRLAEHLIRRESTDLVREAGGLSPDVVETAALCHDLGHPPFGHIAEEELDRLLRLAEVPDGFEGNAQSFRILTVVAIRRTETPGLNLCRATLNASIKYPWRRDVDGDAHRKWGYYFSEKEDFLFARAPRGENDRLKCAEAALMDWADDVAYSVHDVDDFYRAGLVPIDRILLGGTERSLFLEKVRKRWEKRGTQRLWETMGDEGADRFLSNLSSMASSLDRPYVGNRDQRAGLNRMASFLISRYVMGSDGEYAVALDPSNPGNVIINSRLRAEVELLKDLMRQYVFENPALLAQQTGQRVVVKKLFRILHRAAQANSGINTIIPHPFRESLESNTGLSPRERARVAADIIASMTEQQALSLHHKLSGAASGSIRDLLMQ